VRATLTRLAVITLGACAHGVALAAAGDPTGHVFAAPSTAAQPVTPSATGLGQVAFALLLVLCAVFAVAWMVKRVRGMGNRVGDAIDVIADIPLGQKERAVLLKVGQTQILVGVAPGHINTLHVLTEPLDLTRTPAASNDPRPNFKALLMRSLGK
jgi:flagellar protein FliO/FliZ